MVGASMPWTASWFQMGPREPRPAGYAVRAIGAGLSLQPKMQGPLAG